MTNSNPKTTFRKILFLTLALCSFSCTWADNKSVPTTATQADFHPKSNVFTVKADGREMFAEHFKQIHYADFTVSKSQIPVEVHFNGQITSASVSPAIQNIETKVSGNNITFTLPKNGWYVLTVNDNQKLFLFANAAKKAPQGKKVMSVMDFVTDSTGKTVQTAELQKALDEASKSEKTLFFPRGIYLSGMLTIGSNTDIYLADGAMIKGTSEPDSYPVDAGRKESGGTNGEFMTFSRLIFVNNAQNVKIRGLGTIDGSGSTLRNQKRPIHLIRVCNSKNVLIEDVILRDPASWNTHILYSEDVTIRGVKIMNDANVPNTDGFDPDASRHVLIDGCFSYCSDDNIAIKSTNNSDLLRDLEDVTVRNCVFLTRKTAMKVGTETKAAHMSRILFENNDIIESDRAMALYCYDGATFENIRFINNRVEKNYPDRMQRVLQFELKKRSGQGQIKNILVKDLHILQPFPKGSDMTGLDENHLVDGVTFKNVVIGGKRMKSLDDLGIILTPFVKNVVIK